MWLTPRQRIRRKRRKQYARIALENQALVDVIQRYREIVNFQYWRSRCEAEQEDNTLEARRIVRKADEAFKETDFETARQFYEEAWVRWDKVFEKYPLMVDDVEGEDVMEAVVRYKELLAQVDETFPPPGFLLTQLLDEYAYDYDIDLPPSDEGGAGASATAVESEEAVVPDEESTEESETESGQQGEPQPETRNSEEPPSESTDVPADEEAAADESPTEPALIP